ncbi:hypothetical protein LCGC14_3117400, partial [marine sediment metagenome]
LGSQAAANKQFESFTEIAAKTPFALQEIVGASGSLVTAAQQTGASIDELTIITANLASSTGLSFSEAAENISRSLLAGIGSADRFRDKGITPMIAAIAGIADATKLGPQELLQAFRDLAGEGGRFAGAAVEFSKTLGGALSNIGDATDKFKASFGEAFSPQLIAFITEGLIPAINDLTGVVKESEDAIGDLAGDGVECLAMEASSHGIDQYRLDGVRLAAAALINLTRDHLAGKEMEIGRYYQSNGQHIAAINRFRVIIDKYQTTSHVPEALLRLTESYLALGVTDEAQATTAVLGYNFPGSEWYQDSYALLTGVDLRPKEDEGSWISRAWKSVF